MEWIVFLLGAVVIAGLLFVIWKQRSIIQARQMEARESQPQPGPMPVQTDHHDTLSNRLQQEMASADALILKLREQIAHLDSARATQDVRLAGYESRIAQLQTQIDSSNLETAQSKALFSTVSNVAYDLVFVLDENSTVIALNKSADDLLGAQNPIGARLTDVIDAPDLEDLVARALNEEDSLEEQFMVDKHYYRARTQVMRYEEDHFFIGVVMQDITQLVRLNRARRDMVANISHELRTPIANIRMIIEGLFHDQSRPKRKASIASLRAIARETESLQWTVQELLDLSMIESGQAIMKLVEEPLAEIADEAVTRLREKLARKNLNVVRHIPRRLRVLCDRDHILRVFINLINNAVKWSPENDAITISAANSGEEIIISVFDNGPGVPDDQRERIFERFYQVDTARSGNEGSGLGLAICKHVIESHGGVIWAEGNSQGGGGRFLFTLLNAGAGDAEEDAVMDRGQHDALLRPYASPMPAAEEAAYEYGMEGLDDDFEIEFVDDGDEKGEPD